MALQQKKKKEKVRQNRIRTRTATESKKSNETKADMPPAREMCVFVARETRVCSHM